MPKYLIDCIVDAAVTFDEVEAMNDQDAYDAAFEMIGKRLPESQVITPENLSEVIVSEYDEDGNPHFVSKFDAGGNRNTRLIEPSKERLKSFLELLSANYLHGFVASEDHQEHIAELNSIQARAKALLEEYK